MASELPSELPRDFCSEVMVSFFLSLGPRAGPSRSHGVLGRGCAVDLRSRNSRNPRLRASRTLAAWLRSVASTAWLGWLSFLWVDLVWFGLICLDFGLISSGFRLGLASAGFRLDLALIH